MKYIKINNVKYRYKDNIPWKEFSQILDETSNIKIIKWYYKHVLVDKPVEFNTVLLFVQALRNKFGHSEKQFKSLLREAGKCVRGISSEKYGKDIIDFNLIHDLNISYETVQELPWDKVIFFNGMIQEIHRLEKEEHDKAKREAKGK